MNWTLAIAAVLSLVIAAGAEAQAPEQAQKTKPATLGATGIGEVSVVPDMATLRIGVETRGDDAAAAVAANNEAAQAIIDTIKENGVAAEDIQTANFSVSPVYDQSSFQQAGGPQITGYHATNQVVVRVRTLEQLPELLDAAVGSGANRVDGLEFGLADKTTAADEARRLAVQDARRKAEVYAGAAGVELGTLRSISEAGRGPMPVFDTAARAEAMASVPIELGQTTVSASVQMVWELKASSE